MLMSNPHSPEGRVAAKGYFFLTPCPCTIKIPQILVRQKGSFQNKPHSPELARQAKGWPQNYIGVLIGLGITFPFPKPRRLAGRVGGFN